MLVLSAAPLHIHQGNLLPFEQHKSQWTLKEQQKWARHWISAHKKDPKPTITKRHDNYSRSRKKHLRKKSRLTVKHFVHEFNRNPEDFLVGKRLESKYIKNEFDPRFSEDIICNQNYKFTHSLSELTSLPSDFILNRTVHLLFSKHDIPFVGRLTCISHCGFIHVEDLRILGLTAKHRLCHHETLDLMDRSNMDYSKWFHYKCIHRVMVYEEGTRRFRDITSLMMDLMKLKVVQWLKLNYTQFGNSYADLSDIQNCAESYGSYGAFYAKHVEIDTEQKKRVNTAMNGVTNRFQTELNVMNFHMMLLRKHHPKQMEQMTFGEYALSVILWSYVHSGGILDESYVSLYGSTTTESDERDIELDVTPDVDVNGDGTEQEEVAVTVEEAEEKKGFMSWDDRIIHKLSRKMSHRTATC